MIQTVASPDLQTQFVQVIDQHKGILYKVAHAYCKDAEDQQDLVQEMIFQLWKSFKSYDSMYKLSTWMYRIALNVAISSLRKSQVRSQHRQDWDGELIQVAEEAPEDMSEELKLLRQFIQEQKKLDKALLLLYLEGKSHAEIAEVLALSASNVGTRIGRLKKKLKHYLIKRMS